MIARATRVLIVEDDEPSRTAMERYLQAAGYSVASVDNGPEAVRAADRLAPDAVICDWEIKGPIDGVATARRIREIRPGANFILITGESLLALESASRDLSASERLGKPFTLVELVRRLRRYESPD